MNAKDPATWVPKPLFLAYCGEPSEKLAAFYNKAVSKKNVLATSLNWFAVLLFPAWLGYRRQWLLFAVYTGMFALLPFLEAGFHFSFPNGAFVGVGIAIGMMGNGLLLSSANQLYFKLKRQGLADSAILEAMTNKAKGSTGAAIVALIVAVVVVIGAGEIAVRFLGA